MRHSRPAKQTAPASDDNARRGSRGKKKSESPLTPCPCKPLLLYFSHRALLLLLCFKECLLDFTANADQPFFRMSGAVPKIVCLCLKFARSFFGCPQFGGKTVGKIHGSVAVCLRQIRRLLVCLDAHHCSLSSNPAYLGARGRYRGDAGRTPTVPPFPSTTAVAWRGAARASHPGLDSLQARIYARMDRDLRDGVSLLAGIDLLTGKVHALVRDRHRSR